MYKDLVVNKKTLLIFSGAAVFVQILEFMENERGSLLFILFNLMAVVSAFFIMGMCEANLFEQDERKKHAYFIASAADGIKKYVGGKYLLMFAITTLTSIVCIVINAVSTDFVGNTFSVSMLCFFLYYFQLFLRAVDIPFVMAFGSKVGSAVKSAVILLIVFIISAYLLFGDLSAIGITDMDSLWEKLMDLFTGVMSNELIIVFTLAGLAVFPIYYLSYVISCRLYLKGVDRFEK